MKKSEKGWLTLKAVENDIRGQVIITFTYHINSILYPKFLSQRIVRQSLIVEEFTPKEIRHNAGEDNNIVTNYLLRLDMEPRAYNPVESE